MTVGQREEKVAEFRRSVWHIGFWVRTILTLTLYYWILWRRNKITLTTRRVVQRKGNVIGGEEVSINLDRIQDIRVRTGVAGTVFRFGLIEIQSSGSGQAEISFDGLNRPHKLKEMIYDLQDGQLDGGPEKTKVEVY